jgi:hypothetical protein
MNVIPKAVSNSLGRPLLHLQKSSPQIMFAGGIVAGVAGTVLACRATLKLSDVLEGTEKLKFQAEKLHEEAKENLDVDYDDKTYAKDMAVLKVKTLLSITKLYAPSAGLLVLSATLLTGSHVTLNRRNTSLAAAYAATDQAFNKYRERVKEQLGEETDRNLRYGTQEIKETVQGDDGKKKTVTVTRVGEDEPSQYAKFFDKLCDNWKAQPEYNLIFLKAQQQYANDLLQARGHIFLNDVYDMLGIPRTGAGAVVGWLWNNGGDDYVDFGIFDDRTNERVRDFVNGREHSILLDFNVDGVIYDKI